VRRTSQLDVLNKYHVLDQIIESFTIDDTTINASIPSTTTLQSVGVSCNPAWRSYLQLRTVAPHISFHPLVATEKSGPVGKQFAGTISLCLNKWAGHGGIL
jgi:hypothetical protein